MPYFVGYHTSRVEQIRDIVQRIRIDLELPVHIMFKPQDAEARTIKPDRITDIDHDELGDDRETTSIIEWAEHNY